MSATEQQGCEVSGQKEKTLNGEKADAGNACISQASQKKAYYMEIYIKDDCIKLGQAMKLAGLVDEGVEAKRVIQDGEVTVNGEVDVRRGRKLVEGDVFFWNGNEVRIVKKHVD